MNPTNLFEIGALLKSVNERLSAQFPEKHIDITLDDIEKVYGRQLLGINADTKTKKGAKKGYLTGILYLAPASLSGINVCPKASEGCRSACLFSAGRGRFYSVTRARITKTLAYHMDKVRFVTSLKKSIELLVTKAKNKNMVPVVRLNGTSDILFELNTGVMQSFPNVQFYDYTKIIKKLSFQLPANYHLTFSLTESNDSEALVALSKGVNVAVVFNGVLPDTFMGYPVINGDETDLRFLDRKGAIVGLKAKGAAKKDKSGFVRDGGVVENRIAA